MRRLARTMPKTLDVSGALRTLSGGGVRTDTELTSETWPARSTTDTSIAYSVAGNAGTSRVVAAGSSTTKTICVPPSGATAIRTYAKSSSVFCVQFTRIAAGADPHALAVTADDLRSTTAGMSRAGAPVPIPRDARAAEYSGVPNA